MLKIITLGAAAGGGLPQWNCRCGSCTEAWEGRIAHQTQVSLAITANGDDYVLVNASPDIRAQIAATPALWPRAGHLRHSPIKSVVLVNGEVDAVAGLLSLREGQKFDLFAHPVVLDTLAQNSIFNVLNPANVSRNPLALDTPFTTAGLTITAFTIPGKKAWYLEGEGYDPKTDISDGDTLGLTIRAAGKTVHIILACAAMTPELADRLRGADLVFFDGTLWQDDEMITQGLAQKTGARMGHMAMSGHEGTIAALAPLDIGRKVFVHINNSNPVWCETAPERAALTAAGWDIPAPGQEYSL